MLRLLLALAALLSAPVGHLWLSGPAPAPAPQSAQASAAWSPGTSVFVDDRFLPGPDGWFLLPITTDAVTHVEVALNGRTMTTSDTGAWMRVVAFPGDLRLTGLGGGAASRTADANAGGRNVACCGNPVVNGGAASGWRDDVRGRLVPGQTLWIGLVATGYDPRSQFGAIVTADPGVHVFAGAAHSGARVASVDLIDLASRAGTNAQLLGAGAGWAGDGEFAWHARGTSLVSLLAETDGGARATFTTKLVNGTTSLSLEKQQATLTAAKWGDITLTTQDVAWPSAVDDPEEFPSSASARALFADVDVRLDGYSLVVEPVK